MFAHPRATFLLLAFAGVAGTDLLAFGCATGSNGGGMFGSGMGGRHAGTPWTILCLEIQGAYASDYIEQFATTLKNTPGIRSDDVKIVREDETCQLLYGTYFRRTDKETGRRSIPAQMKSDLELLRELVGTNSERYFARARVVRNPQPSAGNPAWSLTRASGAYTLQVAAFEPTDTFWEQKKAAAEYCEWLRGKGYEAYYHHGPACSIVTVGIFDERAVEETRPGMGFYSHDVRELQKDELLKYNLVNGAIIRAKKLEFGDIKNMGAMSRALSERLNPEEEPVPIPSRLVRIPGSNP
jgi:hypothetical protein